MGHPESFLANLAAEEIQPIWSALRRDHAAFDRQAAGELRRVSAARRLDWILVTEKDAVKLEEWAGQLPPVLVIGAELQFVRGEALLQRALADRLLAARLIME